MITVFSNIPGIINDFSSQKNGARRKLQPEVLEQKRREEDDWKRQLKVPGTKGAAFEPREDVFKDAFFW